MKRRALLLALAMLIGWATAAEVQVVILPGAWCPLPHAVGPADRDGAFVP
jgi:hypothetical protein